MEIVAALQRGEMPDGLPDEARRYEEIVEGLGAYF